MSWELLRPGSSWPILGRDLVKSSSMNYQRFYFGSNVLLNGDVFVQGGEDTNDPNVKDGTEKVDRDLSTLANRGMWPHGR